MKTGAKYLLGALFLLLILTTCVLAASAPVLADPTPEVDLPTSGFIQLADEADAPPETEPSVTEPPTTEAPTPPPTTPAPTPQPTVTPPEPTLYDGESYIINGGHIYEETNTPDEVTQNEEPPRRPMIALTFDDGPSRYTVQILDTLAAHNAQATFFVLGNRVIQHPHITRRIVHDGHELLGHSWSHRDMTSQNRDNVADAINRTSSVLYGVGGVRTNLFRPPYGAFNARVREVAAELGYAIVMWTVDPQDWRLSNQCANFLYNHIINNAYDGAIVVLHDVFATTADAMEYVIPRLIADGFELVTVTELLEYFFDEIIPGTVYYGMWR
ncbi:MAG: polysaccharide deacetylase family protein [Defluviitaleaceae bacterium]|nr:polysaccharide deacetylase family protein [Defluviitaleaceae bacterium]